MYSLHLLDSYPNLIYHLDQTIINRTLDLNVGLIELFLKLLYYLKFKLKVKVLHVDRKIDFQQLQSMVNNRIIKLSISIHLSFHIF